MNFKGLLIDNALRMILIRIIISIIIDRVQVDVRFEPNGARAKPTQLAEV
jgi:hypothetical protein